MRPDLFENLAAVEEQHWWFRARKRIILEVVRARVSGEFPPGELLRVLDVGAGTGLLADALTNFGSVDALESAPEALRFLRRRENLRVHEGRIPAPQLPDSSFDLVTAFDVIEHIEDHSAAVSDIFRLVRSGGYFLMTVPAGPWLWSEHDEIHHHFRRYTLRNLRHLLGEAGFSVEFISPFQTLLFPAFVASRLVRKVIGSRDDGGILRVPPSPLNGLLEAVFQTEKNLLAKGVRLPFGSSLVALSKKPPP